MSQEPVEKRFPLFVVYSDPVVVTDSHGQIVYVNAAFEELSGYGRNEVVGETPRIYKSGKQDQSFYEQLWQTILSGQAFQAKFINKKKSGEMYPMEETIAPFRDDTGETYFVSIGRDLTLSRHTALELQKLALVAEQSTDHIMITTPEGIIEYVNPAFEAFTGFSGKEAIGKTPRIVKSGEHSQSYYAALWSDILAGKVFRGVTINRKKGGDLYYEEKTITPIKDGEGNVLYFVSVGRDITEKMEAEKELRTSGERLIMMNQILEKYTQPAVLKILNSGSNPLHVPPSIVTKTVFFTDMMDFSLLSERLKIEDLTKLVQMYLNICSNVIAQYGGEVIKFMGDGAMAYFPVDGVDQAIRAGLEIVAEIESFREMAPATSPLSVLYAGVGISHGKVTEGNIGSNIKQDYTILGDTVNIASRLEALTRQLAVPLCLTAEVKANAREPWAFYDLGKHTVRGRNTRIDIYSVHDARIRTSFVSEGEVSRKIYDLFAK